MLIIVLWRLYDGRHKKVATHNAGKGAKYTKLRRPVRLLYYETFADKSSALKAEYAFKHQSRLKKERYLIAHGIESTNFKRDYKVDSSEYL